MRVLTTTAFAAAFAILASVASAATYDFKAYADSAANNPEQGFLSFDTSSVFVGPSLTITASKSGNDAYVYFDRDNAGVGVCGTLISTEPSGTNTCNPASDDGINVPGTEILTFTANQDMVIDSIYINSNHDAAPVQSTVWNIGGTIYSGPFTVASISGTGDIRIDLGIMLLAGQFFTVDGVTGPNSYISALSVTPVPLPAAGFLLLGGLGGIAAMKRRKKA